MTPQHDNSVRVQSERIDYVISPESQKRVDEAIAKFAGILPPDATIVEVHTLLASLTASSCLMLARSATNKGEDDPSISGGERSVALALAKVIHDTAKVYITSAELNL